LYHTLHTTKIRRLFSTDIIVNVPQDINNLSIGASGKKNAVYLCTLSGAFVTYQNACQISSANLARTTRETLNGLDIGKFY